MSLLERLGFVKKKKAQTQFPVEVTEGNVKAINQGSGWSVLESVDGTNYVPTGVSVSKENSDYAGAMEAYNTTAEGIGGSKFSNEEDFFNSVVYGGFVISDYIKEHGGGGEPLAESIKDTKELAFGDEEEEKEPEEMTEYEKPGESDEEKTMSDVMAKLPKEEEVEGLLREELEKHSNLENIFKKAKMRKESFREAFDAGFEAGKASAMREDSGRTTVYNLFEEAWQEYLNAGGNQYSLEEFYRGYEAGFDKVSQGEIDEGLMSADISLKRKKPIIKDRKKVETEGSGDSGENGDGNGNGGNGEGLCGKKKKKKSNLENIFRKSKIKNIFKKAKFNWFNRQSWTDRGNYGSGEFEGKISKWYDKNKAVKHDVNPNADDFLLEESSASGFKNYGIRNNIEENLEGGERVRNTSNVFRLALKAKNRLELLNKMANDNDDDEKEEETETKPKDDDKKEEKKDTTGGEKKDLIDEAIKIINAKGSYAEARGELEGLFGGGGKPEEKPDEKDVPEELKGAEEKDEEGQTMPPGLGDPALEAELGGMAGGGVMTPTDLSLAAPTMTIQPQAAEQFGGPYGSRTNPFTGSKKSALDLIEEKMEGTPEEGLEKEIPVEIQPVEVEYEKVEEGLVDDVEEEKTDGIPEEIVEEPKRTAKQARIPTAVEPGIDKQGGTESEIAPLERTFMSTHPLSRNQRL